MVEEHCQCIEAVPVRSSGALRRENAGMSSEKEVESSWPNIQGFRGKADLPRVSQDTKARQKCVADGQQVEIPALPYIRNVGTHQESVGRGKERPVQAKEGTCRQIRMSTQERYAERRIVAKHTDRVPRKAAIVYMMPYRKPTQVDEERILRPAGEALLRNSAKWRNLGIRCHSDVAAENRLKQLFSKKQVYAKPRGEVYGLTPARCWKVKRRGQGNEALN